MQYEDRLLYNFIEYTSEAEEDSSVNPQALDGASVPGLKTSNNVNKLSKHSNKLNSKL